MPARGTSSRIIRRMPAWAMEWIDREMDARPITVQAMVREAEATFSGRGFRVVRIAWERYRDVLAVAVVILPPDPSL